MSAKLKPIKWGLKLSHSAYNKMWLRYRHLKGDVREHHAGAYVSPHGRHWRPCGLHYPAILLVNWETGDRHSVDWGTLTKLIALGWKWVPDRQK